MNSNVNALVRALSLDTKQTAIERTSEFLHSKCDRVVEMNPKAVRAVWKAWRIATPLRPKRHGQTGSETLFDRISWVTGSLNGRRGIEAFNAMGAQACHVFMCDHLTGWTIARRPIEIEAVDENLVITPIDFSWTFAIQKFSGRLSYLERYVFVAPMMDDLDVDGFLRSLR